MNHRYFCLSQGNRCMNLKIIAGCLIGFFLILSAWAGLAEDEALREAEMKLDLAGIKSAIQQKANPNAPSTDKQPTTPLGAVTMGLLLHRDDDSHKNGFIRFKRTF